ncbi:MAG: hypothetical protein JSS10_03620 [Verrucomicrobia bacterium]|nr:hypothetical protein [Verrucomicrobiota bacterium]
MVTALRSLSLPFETLPRGSYKRAHSFCEESPGWDSPSSPELLPTLEVPLTQPEEENPLQESSSSVEEGFVIPENRCPPVSKSCDTAYFDTNLRIWSQHGSVDRLIEDDYILKKHVLKYIDCGPYKATDKVVAVTRSGKHVVWQQAVRSCVPAAISMIALDRQKQFLAKELTHPVTTREREIGYIQKAGFQPVYHLLKGTSIEKVQALQKLFLKVGSGLLHLNLPGLNSHMCVLDEISWETSRVTIRDSIKGERITVRLFPFADWIGEEFVELQEKMMAHPVGNTSEIDSKKRRAVSESGQSVQEKPKRPLLTQESSSSVASLVPQDRLTAEVRSPGRRFLMESYHEDIDGHCPSKIQ